MTEQEWLTSTDPAAMLRILRCNGGESLRGEPFQASDRKLRLFATSCCRAVWDQLVDDASCPDSYRGGSSRLGCIAGEVMVRDAHLGKSYSYRAKCKTCGGTGRINRSRRAVEVAERYADGQAKAYEVEVFTGQCETIARCLHPGDAINNATSVVGTAQIHNTAILPTYASLLRDIFGNPFRPVMLAEKYTADGAEKWTKAHRGEISLLDPAWLTPTVIAVARCIYDNRGFEDMPILADALEEAGCRNEAILRHCRNQEFPCGPNFTYPQGPHVRGCWVVDLILGKE